MVGFQGRVGAPKPGLPGQIPIGSQDPIVTDTDYWSDGTLNPGDFAFAASDEGPNANIASKTGNHLLGIVVRSSGSYCAGAIIPIAVIGAIYVDVPEYQTPSSGQAVLCDPVTGEVTYGKAGDPNDTGWDVQLLPRQFNVQGGDMVIYKRLGSRTSHKS